MNTKVGQFSFKIPTPEPGQPERPDAGKKVEKAFEYQECETLDEAMAVIAEKKWDVKDMVNETLKANARSNAYQAALLPYRPSEVSQDDIKERIIRDYIRSGFSEEVARAQVEGMFANIPTPSAS